MSGIAGSPALRQRARAQAVAWTQALPPVAGGHAGWLSQRLERGVPARETPGLPPSASSVCAAKASGEAAPTRSLPRAFAALLPDHHKRELKSQQRRNDMVKAYLQFLTLGTSFLVVFLMWIMKENGTLRDDPSKFDVRALLWKCARFLSTCDVVEELLVLQASRESSESIKNEEIGGPSRRSRGS